MSTGFKFTVFSLIVVFAVVVSQMSVGMSRQSGPGVTTRTNVAPRAGTAARTSGIAAGRASAAAGRSDTATSRTGFPTRIVSTIKVSKVSGQKLLLAPKAGDLCKLGDLFNLINTNDPQFQRARFQVFVTGNPPSSKSSDNFGLTKDWIMANKDLTVTIKMDDTGIIALMEAMGIFPKESDIEKAKAYGWDEVFRYTRDNFKKILLYFIVPGFDQKFYLIDVWSQTSQIKWNAGFKPEQVCRPYRLLMDWIVG